MLVCLNFINKGFYTKNFNDKIFLINSSVNNNLMFSNWPSCHVIISDGYVIIAIHIQIKWTQHVKMLLSYCIHLCISHSK